MQALNLAVFAYNFPHKKTQDFLTRLFLEGYKITVVVAADPVKLNIPPSTIRTKIRHGTPMHPRAISESIGAEYHVLPHNSPECVNLLKSKRCELGVIAGARVLKSTVIDSLPAGIINFHPDLIPEARGLDSLLWSILDDVPLGVTAHLIDRHIDRGTVLLKRTIPVLADDTVFDLSEKLTDLQLEMIGPAIEAALEGQGTPVDPDTPYNRKMPAELEHQTLKKLNDYIGHFASEGKS